MLPCKDTSREQEQIRFIQRWKRGDGAFTELCRQLGMGRKTGFKRVERYKLWGWDLRVPSERPGLISLTGATYFRTNVELRVRKDEVGDGCGCVYRPPGRWARPQATPDSICELPLRCGPLDYLRACWAVSRAPEPAGRDRQQQ